jgi:phosphate transport system substrate-binding protein
VHSLNIPLNEQVILDRPTLARIYLGEIRRWDHQDIISLNQHLIEALAEPICAVHRLDKSGTTEIFTRALSSFSKEWAQTFGAASSVEWSLQNCTSTQDNRIVPGGVFSNEQMVTHVLSSRSAIGYTDLQRAVQDGLPMVQLVNRGGIVVAPSADSISRALEDLLIDIDQIKLTSLLTDSGSIGAWPIVGLSYLAFKPLGDCVKMQLLFDFAQWILTADVARESLVQLNFAHMPADVVAKIEHRLASFACAGGEIIRFALSRECMRMLLYTRGDAPFF